MNQLTPGWLLEYSPYTIARSEVKFANRRTAKRHDFYTGWKILRPGTMDLLCSARNALMNAEQQHQSVGEATNSKKIFKMDRDIPGLGANQLNEKGRQIGIKAYTDAIQRYALRGLLSKMVSFVNNQRGISVNEALSHVGLDSISEGGKLLGVDGSHPHLIVNWPVLPWNEASHADKEALWKHQHAMLMNELSSILGSGSANGNDVLNNLLQKCIVLEDDHAKRVYKSKSRDDERGASTVPGYKDAHIPAENDSVVLMAKNEASDVRNDVQLVQEALGLIGNTRSRL